jgi:hypothetical protein
VRNTTPEKDVIHMRYLFAASFVTVVVAAVLAYAVPSEAGPSFSNSTMTTTPTTSTTTNMPAPPGHMGY